MPNEIMPSDNSPSKIDLKASFDERLRQVSVSNAEETTEALKAGQKLVRDKLAGLFKITDLINAVFKWNEEAEKALKGLKRDKLLETYFQLVEDNDRAISQLRELLTSASGNTLFNKIVGILDDGPPEQEMLDHLAVALTNIINSDFELLFSAHKHALAQIGRLTPQALTILADARSWPPFALPSRTTDGGIVRSEWNPEFSSAYALAKGVSDPKATVRIGHSIFELQNARLVMAAEKDTDVFRCFYTEIGNEIRKYLQV